MNVDEIAAALSTAEEKASAADAHFETAGSELDECRAALQQALQGATDQQTTGAVAMLLELNVTPLRELVKRAIAEVSAYRKSLQGEPPAEPAAQSQATSTPPSQSEPAAEPAEVAAARAELPPPVVPGTGAKTHGRWTTPDVPGDLQPIVSGRKDDMYADADRYLTENGMDRYSIASHVETKLAVHMRNTDLTSATVTINHTPCEGALGCDTLLPRVLPPGATLTVYGTTSDGRHTVKTYTGRTQE